MKIYKNPWVTRESYFVKTGAVKSAKMEAPKSAGYAIDFRRDIIKEWRNSKRTKRAQETISLSTPIHDKSGNEYELEEVLPGAKNVDWCDSKAWWDSLTDRQREILRYRYDGKTYREIAEILGYSHTLIETEVRIAHKEAKRYL